MESKNSNSPRRSGQPQNSGGFITAALLYAGVAGVLSPSRRHSQENDATMENGAGLQEVSSQDFAAALGEFGGAPIPANSPDYPQYHIPDYVCDFIDENMVNGVEGSGTNGVTFDLPILDEPALNEPCTSKAVKSNGAPRNEGEKVKPHSRRVSSDDSDFEQIPKTKTPLNLKKKARTPRLTPLTPTDMPRTPEGTPPTPGRSSKREVKTPKKAVNDRVQAGPSSMAAGPSRTYQVIPISLAPQNRTKAPTLRALLAAGSSLPGGSNQGAEKTPVTKPQGTKRAAAPTLVVTKKGKAPLKKSRLSLKCSTWTADNITAEAGCSGVILAAEKNRASSKSQVAVRIPIPIEGSDSESEFEIFSQPDVRETIKKFLKYRRQCEKEYETVNQTVREAETSLAAAEENLRRLDAEYAAERARALQAIDESRAALEASRNSLERAKKKKKTLDKKK